MNIEALLKYKIIDENDTLEEGFEKIKIFIAELEGKKVLDVLEFD